MHNIIKTSVSLLALALALCAAHAAESGSLRLGTPLVQFRTNLYFQSQNPAPECPCNLERALSVKPPVTWTSLIEGLPSQTNFNVISTPNPAFYRLRYKSFIQAPATIYAGINTPRALTNIQILPFQSTGQLTMSATFGPLKFGNTNGLTFTAGANNMPSFTVAGTYAALSNGLSTLSYTGTAGNGATDVVNIVLANFGAYARCGDSNAVRIPLDSPPLAYDATFTGVGQLNVPAPGLLNSAFDPEGDPLAVVPQTITGTYGQLMLNADGSLTYRPTSPPSSPILEIFSFRVYDTFGGGIHSTSTPQRLTIEIHPISGAPR